MSIFLGHDGWWKATCRHDGGADGQENVSAVENFPLKLFKRHLDVGVFQVPHEHVEVVLEQVVQVSPSEIGIAWNGQEVPEISAISDIKRMLLFLIAKSYAVLQMCKSKFSFEKRSSVFEELPKQDVDWNLDLAGWARPMSWKSSRTTSLSSSENIILFDQASPWQSVTILDFSISFFVELISKFRLIILSRL